MKLSPLLRSLTALSLMALSPAAPAQDTNAREQLENIRRELREESEHVGKAAKQDADPAAVSEIFRSYREEVMPEFAQRFAELARSEAASDVALEAWIEVIWLASSGYQGELSKEALAALVRDHVRSERLASVVPQLRWSSERLGAEAVTAALRTLAGASPHRRVQAHAIYALGAVLGEDRPAGDPRIAEAKAEFAKLSAYADLEMQPGLTFADAATAFVFALDNLVLGKPCPDFEALDAEGKAFRLSDYAGKVVLLDFWGFW